MPQDVAQSAQFYQGVADVLDQEKDLKKDAFQDIWQIKLEFYLLLTNSAEYLDLVV